MHNVKDNSQGWEHIHEHVPLQDKLLQQNLTLFI